MSANKKAREAKRIFMNAKTEQDQKRAAVEAAMGKMTELRGKLMDADVERATARLQIATAERKIAEEQNYPEGQINDCSVRKLRVEVAKGLEAIATIDLNAATLLREHDKIRLEFQGV